MQENLNYAFPAGDESDGSSDEWNVGCSSDAKKLDPEVKVTLKKSCPSNGLAKKN